MSMDRKKIEAEVRERLYSTPIYGRQGDGLLDLDTKDAPLRRADKLRIPTLEDKLLAAPIIIGSEIKSPIGKFSRFIVDYLTDSLMTEKQASLDSVQITARARAMYDQFLDYIQLVKTRDGDEKARQEVEEISRRLGSFFSDHDEIEEKHLKTDFKNDSMVKILSKDCKEIINLEETIHAYKLLLLERFKRKELREMWGTGLAHDNSANREELKDHFKLINETLQLLNEYHYNHPNPAKTQVLTSLIMALITASSPSQLTIDDRNIILLKTLLHAYQQVPQKSGLGKQHLHEFLHEAVTSDVVEKLRDIYHKDIISPKPHY